MRKDNKGLTLIELVVTIAIIAIFSGVILTFIGTGANSYRSTSSNAEAQKEVQHALDQIQNLVIDANRSVYYAYGKGIDEEIGEPLVNDIDDGTSQSKTFFVKNAVPVENKENTFLYHYETIEWDSEEEKLFYAYKVGTKEVVEVPSEKEKEGEGAEPAALAFGEGDASPGGGLNDGTSAGNDAGTGEVMEKVSRTVLAEDIVGFEADITKAASERIVRFQITTDKRGKQIKTLHTVNLRNQVQIARPDEGYISAKPARAWIVITDYPETLRPEEKSSKFAFLKDGNIDMDSVKWVVDPVSDKVDNGDYAGSFNGDDGPGTPTITVSTNAKAKQKIWVYVTARTKDGKDVKSPSVKILIDKAGAQLNGTEELVLGIGNMFDLCELVELQVKYDNADTEIIEKDVDWAKVKWSMEPGWNDISLYGSKLFLHDSDVLGTEPGNSAFEITAAYESNGETLTKSITVKLARIDLIDPNNEKPYHVGDEKPWDYVYREGGVPVELPEEKVVKIFTKPTENANAGDYFASKIFADTDIGTWKVEIQTQVSEVGGIVKDKGMFTVEMNTSEKEGNILVNKQTDISTVAAGYTYICSPTINWGFMFMPSDVTDFWSQNSEIHWSLDGTYPGITIEAGGGDSEPRYCARVNVADAEDVNALSGFRLKAEYIQYTDSTKEHIKEIRYGYKEVNVAYGVKIQPQITDNFVYYGDGYPLHAVMNMVTPDGVHVEVPVTPESVGLQHEWVNISNDMKVADDGLGWEFVPNKDQIRKTIEVRFHLKELYGVFSPNTTFTFEDTVQVEVRTYPVTPEIVIVDQKTSILPGEVVQYWLKLGTEKGVIDGTANWTVGSQQFYQQNVKNNLNAYTADSSIKQITTVQISANYTTETGETGTVSTVITISPLTMVLDCQNYELYYGLPKEVITAYIYDSRDDSNVTDKYTIEWSYAPVEDAYSLEKQIGDVNNFVISKGVDSEKYVTITAIAKNEKGEEMCRASAEIKISPKTTITKTYSLTADLSRPLEFNTDHQNNEVMSVKASYLPATGTVPTECKNLNRIPTLTLTIGKTASEFSVHMDSDATLFEQYKYILVSVDLGTVLYNFYIYPVKYNVYNGNGEAFTFAPGNTDTIKKLSTIDSDGYTCIYTDPHNVRCELRLSINKKTCAGSKNTNNNNHSMGKWFMKRAGIYYRYDNGGWYEYNNGGENTTDQDRQNWAQYYWPLNTTIKVGGVGTGAGVLTNIFWQYWN